MASVVSLRLFKEFRNDETRNLALSRCPTLQRRQNLEIFNFEGGRTTIGQCDRDGGWRGEGEKEKKNTAEQNPREEQEELGLRRLGVYRVALPARFLSVCPLLPPPLRRNRSLRMYHVPRSGAYLSPSVFLLIKRTQKIRFCVFASPWPRTIGRADRYQGVPDHH